MQTATTIVTSPAISVSRRTGPVGRRTGAVGRGAGPLGFGAGPAGFGVLARWRGGGAAGGGVGRAALANSTISPAEAVDDMGNGVWRPASWASRYVVSSTAGWLASHPWS